MKMVKCNSLVPPSITDVKYKAGSLTLKVTDILQGFLYLEVPFRGSGQHIEMSS